MRAHRATLAVALLVAVGIALSPSASARSSQLCGKDIWIGDVFQDCHNIPGDDGQCEGVTVIVLSPEACRDPGGPGCRGVTVIVGSPESCHGGAGKVGCEGTQIIDPSSSGSCKGGSGGGSAPGAVP